MCDWERVCVRLSVLLRQTHHVVGHVSQPAGQSLGVMTHGPPPHVFRKSSKHMGAACCLGDGHQHGVHLCSPGLGKR